MSGNSRKKMIYSVEMAARILRYRAYSECMVELKAQKIATAHHLDDLVETHFFQAVQRNRDIRSCCHPNPKEFHYKAASLYRKE